MTTLPSEHSTPNQEQWSSVPLLFQFLKAPNGSLTTLSLNFNKAKPAVFITKRHRGNHKLSAIVPRTKQKIKNKRKRKKERKTRDQAPSSFNDQHEHRLRETRTISKTCNPPNFQCPSIDQNYNN